MGQIAERLKRCDCGSEKEYTWSTLCDSCRKKKDTKDIIQIIVGVFVSLVIISLLVATCFEYAVQIDSFFVAIETSVSDWFNTLSSFVQMFLKTMALGISSILLLGLMFFALSEM